MKKVFILQDFLFLISFRLMRSDEIKFSKFDWGNVLEYNKVSKAGWSLAIDCVTNKEI